MKLTELQTYVANGRRPVLEATSMERRRIRQRDQLDTFGSGADTQRSQCHGRCTYSVYVRPWLGTCSNVRPGRCCGHGKALLRDLALTDLTAYGLT